MSNLYEDFLVGAINTYIRIINETNALNGEEEQLIEDRYEYLVHPSTNNFHLFLVVERKQRELVFSEEEWDGPGKNALANSKLKQLHDELTAARK